MNVMRNDIGLLGNDIYGKVAGDKAPKLIPEGIGAMGAITMVPDGAMRAHEDHAVKKGNTQQVKVKIPEQEDKQTRDQDEQPEPAEKGQPVLPRPEDIQPEKELF